MKIDLTIEQAVALIKNTPVNTPEQIKKYRTKAAMYRRCAAGKKIDCAKCIGCTSNQVCK